MISLQIITILSNARLDQFVLFQPLLRNILNILVRKTNQTFKKTLTVMTALLRQIEPLQPYSVSSSDL